VRARPDSPVRRFITDMPQYNCNTSSDSDVEEDPTVYEPRYQMEAVYLDTEVRAIDTICREVVVYDDSPGDVHADLMVRAAGWLGPCRA
jgi:hypothetical protein